MNGKMSRKSEKRDIISRSVDGYRTDRVKRSEFRKMLKLWEKGKTIADIAHQLKRSERTVSKHLEKAKASIRQNERMLDPLVIEAKKKHIADVAAIAEALLANSLDTVTKHTGIGGTDKIIYSTNSAELLSHEQLGDSLRVNWGQKWARMTDEEKIRFLIHLKADYPELVSNDFLTIVSENPFEMVKALRILIRRGTLKGECDICEQLRE
jgi:transcriptional regulator